MAWRKKAYSVYTVHASAKRGFTSWVEEHGIFHVINLWNESFLFHDFNNEAYFT